MQEALAEATEAYAAAVAEEQADAFSAEADAFSTDAALSEAEAAGEAAWDADAALAAALAAGATDYRDSSIASVDDNNDVNGDAGATDNSGDDTSSSDAVISAAVLASVAADVQVAQLAPVVHVTVGLWGGQPASEAAATVAEAVKGWATAPAFVVAVEPEAWPQNGEDGVADAVTVQVGRVTGSLLWGFTHCPFVFSAFLQW